MSYSWTTAPKSGPAVHFPQTLSALPPPPQCQIINQWSLPETTGWLYNWKLQDTWWGLMAESETATHRHFIQKNHSASWRHPHCGTPLVHVLRNKYVKTYVFPGVTTHVLILFWMNSNLSCGRVSRNGRTCILLHHGPHRRISYFFCLLLHCIFPHISFTYHFTLPPIFIQPLLHSF